jgi:hypothetical protein
MRFDPRPNQRVLNINGRQKFFQEIRSALGVNITNREIENQLNPELTFGTLLNRNLTNRELEWLGPVRTRNIQRPRAMTPNTIKRLKDRYASPSPERPKRKTNNVVFVDTLVHPTSNDKVKNKVFLMTELVNGKIKYVYERSVLNKMNRSPFTQKPYKPHHIKPYDQRNVIVAEMKNLRNKSWNAEYFENKVLNDLARGKVKKHHHTFFKLFPTKRSLARYMDLPNAWPLENMKSLGEFTAKDIKRMAILKRAIDRETDDDLKRLYENRLILVVSNKYGYRPQNFAPMLRRFMDKVPRNMLNVVKV